MGGPGVVQPHPTVAKPTIGTTVRGGSSGGGGSSIGPVLYVAQLVSSTLTWAAQGVVVTQVASLYEPGPSARCAAVCSFVFMSQGFEVLGACLRVFGRVLLF